MGLHLQATDLPANSSYDSNSVVKPRGDTAGSADLGYLLPLDGLRGIAVLLVLTCHFGGAVFFSPSLAGRWWTAVARSGWIGVDLFFVLSGFLITRILLRERDRPAYFRTFYARRTLRIFPLYYSVLIIACGTSFVGRSASGNWFADGRWALWAYVVNIWEAFHGRFVGPIGRIYFDHFWSLSIEEQFYLVWPAIVLVLSRRRLLWVCVASVVIACSLRIGGTLILHQTAFACTFTLCRIDGLAIGSGIAILGQTMRGRQLVLRLAIPAIFTAGAGLIALFGIEHGLEPNSPLSALVGLTLTPAFFGGIIGQAAYAPAGSVGTIASHRPLVLLGRYSYGLYVFHYILLRPLFYLTHHLTGLAAGGTAPLGAVFAFTCFGIVVSLGCAVASYHFFEMRFLRLKRFFVYS